MNNYIVTFDYSSNVKPGQTILHKFSSHNEAKEWVLSQDEDLKEGYHYVIKEKTDEDFIDMMIIINSGECREVALRNLIDFFKNTDEKFAAITKTCRVVSVIGLTEQPQEILERDKTGWVQFGVKPRHEIKIIDDDDFFSGLE